MILSARIISILTCSAGLLSAAWSQSQTTDPKRAVAPADEAIYQLQQEFENSSLAAVAFGAYVDPASGEQTIVLPADVALQSIQQSAAALNVRVARRLQPVRLTRQAQTELERLIVERRYHPEANKYSMGTYFDLKSGKQVLITDAPQSVTQKLLDAFPSQIDLQFGAITTTASRQADRETFSGAAGTKGAPTGGYCTSGWKVRRGTILGLLTAGHCQDPSSPHWVDTWDAAVYGVMPNKSVNPDIGFIYWTRRLSTQLSPRHLKPPCVTADRRQDG